MAAEDGKSLNRKSSGGEYDNVAKKPCFDDNLDEECETDEEQGICDSGSELVVGDHVLNPFICCPRG